VQNIHFIQAKGNSFNIGALALETKGSYFCNTANFCANY